MKAADHLTKEECASYWRRTLAPETLLRLSDHLKDCATCRNELQKVRPPAERDQEVSYEEMVDWIEGSLAPLKRREIAERLANSPAASGELADLQRFRQAMDELPAHNYSLEDLPSPRPLSWILPIAAGLALGFAFLWWSNSQRTESGLVLNDAGQQIVLKQDGSVPALGVIPPDLQNSVKEAATKGEPVIEPTLTNLRGTNGNLAGAPESEGGLVAVSPIATVVETSQPTLRWKAKPTNAANTEYRINLVNQRDHKLISSPLLKASERTWAPTDPLTPGQTYEWEVECLQNGELVSKAPAPPEPEARFRILSDDQRKELETVRTRFGHSNLLMGLAYARLGLIPEARAEFETLAAKNPERELPRKLLASLTSKGR